MDSVLNKFYGTNARLGIGAYNSPMHFSNNNKMNLSHSQRPYPLYDIRGQQQPQLKTKYSFPKNLISTIAYNNPYQPLDTNYVNPTLANYNNSLIARPTYSRNPMAKTSIIPYIPPIRQQENTTPIDQLYAPSLTKRFYTPEVLKLQILEEKIQRMDKTHKEDTAIIKNIIEGQIVAQTNNQPLQVNPTNIQQQQIPNNQMERESRRMEIKKQIEEARVKLRHDNNKNHSYRHYSRTQQSDSDYNNDDDDDSRSRDRDSFESVRFKGRKASLVSQTAPLGLNTVATNNNLAPRQSILLPNLSSPNRKRSVLYAPTVNTDKARQETYDLIQQIPNHCAFQLQSDTFKTRENIILIKSGLKEMRVDMQNRLEQMEMKEKLNLENIRYALEKGGTTKLIYAVKKYLDKDDVNLDAIAEDVPEYVKSIPGIVDQLINEREKNRKEEEMLERKRYWMERQQMENEDMFTIVYDEMKKKMNDEKIEKEKAMLPLINNKIGKESEVKKKIRGRTAKGKANNEANNEELSLRVKKKKKKKIDPIITEIDPNTFPGNAVKPKKKLKLEGVDDAIQKNVVNPDSGLIPVSTKKTKKKLNPIPTDLENEEPVIKTKTKRKSIPTEIMNEEPVIKAKKKPKPISTDIEEQEQIPKNRSNSKGKKRPKASANEETEPTNQFKPNKKKKVAV